MTRRAARIAAAALLLSVAGASTATAAESAGDRELHAAEKAYREVDFSGTHEHAAAGLAAGGSRPERVARLAVLAGMAAAALERNDDARFAFILALAVDPSLKLERSLSPKVRGPYLEAQGYWAAHADRLSVHGFTRDGAHVAVRLEDPAHLVSKVAVVLRVRGEPRFEVLTAPAEAAASVALPPSAVANGFDYFVRALDSHGNTLAEDGSENAPLTYAPPAIASPPVAPTTSHRSYVLPVTFGVLGLGAATVGAVFHAKREDSASEWNGPGCEQPGAGTRQEQCGGIQDDVERYGRIAVISYAAAGVFLTTAVVTWFTGAPRGAEPQRDSAATLCGIAGAGVACAGRF